jgi:hypothetical protein
VVALGNEPDSFIKFKSLFDPKTKSLNTGAYGLVASKDLVLNLCGAIFFNNLLHQ